MRPWLLAPVVALLALPVGAHAQSGGTVAPVGPSASPGGAEYGASIKKRTRPLVASRFRVRPGVLVPGGAPVRVVYRVDGPARRVRVRVELVRPGARSASVRIRLGWKLTGRRQVNRFRLREGQLRPGTYVARLHAVADDGRTLRRTATASGRLPVRVKVKPAPEPPPTPPTAPVRRDGVFPVTGSAWSFGGDGARFGADRPNHIHQGQDVMAPKGTPLVSPVAGVVFWRAVQKAGAGHYLVIRGDDGRDYVFMHLVAGSATVAKGDRVSAGQVIGQVGNTGASDGPHLHFEIWPDGWYAKGSEPIDPRPQLEAWLAG